MNITLITYGTEGDTRPLLALAGALAARGHHTHLLADASAAPLAARHGIPFTALAGDIKATLAPGGQLEQVIRKGKGLHEITRAFASIASRHTVDWVRTGAVVARGADAIVFSGLASYAGLAIADGLGIPCIGAGLWPMTPTAGFPSVFLRPRKLPGWANRMTHRLFARLSWQLFAGQVNAARGAVFGQAKRRDYWRGYPILYGCSPTLLPPPGDWPPEVTVCGAWHLPGQEWTPPADLARYLDDGAPPVYVGFGSMVGFDKRRLLGALTEAVGSRRALFYPGWSGVGQADLPDNFFVIGDTPHDWLFPRTSLVIHHGGAGTAHAAARSGAPSLVVPFAGDQFFWAQRLRALGIATVCEDHGRADGPTLGALLDQALDDGMRRRAQDVAARMAREDGNAYAADAIAGGAARRLSDEFNP